MTRQRVIITGGAGDIGSGMGARLALDGFAVTLVDARVPHNESAFLASLGGESKQISFRKADVRNRPEIDAILSEFISDTTIVIANAGIVKSAPFLKITTEQWHEHLDINLTGVFNTLQSAARLFASEKKKGHIILIGSWVGKVPWPEIAAYSVTKAGIEMLAKSAARELAPQGIRVNVIAPGIVRAGLAKHQLETEPQYAKRVAKVIPLGNLQTVEQVAAVASFLCSDGGNYFTGSTLLADGGASLFQFD
jgi:NAD(P)-dependent dehydrogenase (short-subunit alcohol dehydrogenase family)